MSNSNKKMESNNNDTLYFLDIQKKSFHNFIFGEKEGDENLKNVLEYCLNFKTPDERFEFKVKKFHIDHKEISQQEEISIQQQSGSYKLSVNVELEIKDIKYNSVYGKDILLCEIPCITPKGEFLVNGIYRVIVPHLLKVKGVFFSINNLSKEHMARIKPMYGKNIEISTKTLMKTRKNITIKLENTKFNWSVPVIAMWYDNLEGLFNDMFEKKTLELNFNLEKKLFIEQFSNYLLPFSHLTINKNTVLQDLVETNSKALSDIYDNKTESKIDFYYIPEQYRVLLNGINLQMFESNVCVNYLYGKIKSSAILGQADSYIQKTFFDTDFFSLGKIGRYTLNRKFGTSFNDLTLRKEDMKNILFYLLEIYNDTPGYNLDDQYSLTNLYIQTVGQYLANDLRSMTLNLKRNMIEKSRILSRKESEIEIAKEINSPSFINLGKIGVNTRIQRFFLLHPSSQFLSQLNPISSLMHKTKINTMDDSINSSSDYASFESRNIQNSFYGRLCCVTTPDSKMVGLVNFATLHCNINDHGFITSPYKKVRNGIVTDEIIYLSSFEEEKDEHYIADFASITDKKLNNEFIKCRYKGEITLVNKQQIDLVDAYNNQTVSLSSCLIPFLEHNDNTRVSMGSNMMRQIVPSIRTEKPMVSTGLESFVIQKNNYDVIAEDSGKIVYADSKKIKVSYEKNNKNVVEYKTFEYIRTNQNTLAYTKTNVKEGDEVIKGQALTKSFASDQGKLALGKNLLTVVMPYEGLNFEDAIVISDRCVKRKLFDCYFLNEVIVTPEKTKLGYEQITNQIPHIQEKLSDLDENGVIKIGTIVRRGDVIVGKLTPEIREFSSKADEKIMNIVFGEKILNFKNTSVKFQGDIGEIIDVIYIKKNSSSKVSISKKPQTIKIIIGERKPIKIGDKICGRYGNKNIIAKIVAESDMPYLEDGRIAEAVINPLGIVSRMNIGQLMEMNLTLAMKKQNIDEIQIKPYERNNLQFIKDMLIKSEYPENGKIKIFDGKTDEAYSKEVTVGYMYTMPMEHKVDHKFNARSVGSYSAITQQPLSGRSNNGGQRTGQMELWCLEAFGAKSTILEKTSVLSDDMPNKKRLLKNLIFGGYKFKFGRTSTFNFFNQLLTSLCFKSNLELEINEQEKKEKDVTQEDSFDINELTKEKSDISNDNEML